MTDHADIDHTGLTGVGASAFSGVSLTKSATQGAITTETAITFDGEDFDTDTFHESVTNPSRITFLAAGKVMVGGSVEVINLDDGKYIILSLRKNGATVIHGRARDSGSIDTTRGLQFSKLVSVAANDYIELTLSSNDPAGVTVRASADGTSFWAYKVG